VPNLAVELTTTAAGVQVLWWRVVGGSHIAYAAGAFIDEVESERLRVLPFGDPGAA
jgi:hypothetical protein